MKLRIRQISVLLLLVLAISLSACRKPQDSINSTVDSSAPTQVLTPAQRYENACRALTLSQQLAVEYTYSESRTVEGQTFSRSAIGTALYESPGTSHMQALIRESLTYGAYQTEYTQSYIDGVAYAQSGNANFTTNLSSEAFLSYQIPGALLDASLYGMMTCGENPDGTFSYHFSKPTGLEQWLPLPEHAQLTDAQGWAVLDAQGALRESTYALQYTLGEIPYTLEIKSVIPLSQSPNLSQLQPQYPTDCVQLEVFWAPRMILQTVGNLYAATDITCLQTQSAYCEASSIIRNQNLQIDMAGSGSDFMAQADYTVSVTNYTGTPSVNTQRESFRNGAYSYILNGGDPVGKDSVSAQQMRTYCEDLILNCLPTLEALGSATLTDAGDFYCLEFTCDKGISDSVFSKLFQILNLNLDNWAQSIATETPTAYLTICKDTGMPLTMGQSFGRTHVIDSVAYRTTVQTDQHVTLPGISARQNITGESTQLPETEPQTPATPLFYKVTNSKGHTIWLLGTIHVGDNRTGFLPQEIYDALSASEALAVEFDTDAFRQQSITDPVLQAQLSAAYFYADGSAAADHLNPELYRLAYALLLASGSNAKDVPNMKPVIWEALLSEFFLKQGSSLSGEKGLDNRLLALAREQGKEILDLESGLSQLNILTGLSDALQELLLEDTLSQGIDGYCSSILDLYEIWCRGDADELTQALLEIPADLPEEEKSLYQEYNKAMISKRNTAMVEAARKHLRAGKTVFFAVGTSHLLGEDGIVQSLSKLGYKVEQVTYSQQENPLQ